MLLTISRLLDLICVLLALDVFQSHTLSHDLFGFEELTVNANDALLFLLIGHVTTPPCLRILGSLLATFVAHLAVHLIFDLGLLFPVSVPIRLVCGRYPDTRFGSDLASAWVHHWNHFLLDAVPTLHSRSEFRLLFVWRVGDTELSVFGLLLERINGKAVLSVLVSRIVRNVVLVLNGSGWTWCTRPFRFRLLMGLLVQTVSIGTFL